MEHAESCVCGSTDINILQKMNSPASLSEIQCASCGYTVTYPVAQRLAAGKKGKELTRGEVFSALLTLWNKVMINEKLVKELTLSERSYLKDGIVEHLLQLTSLIEAADTEGVVLSADSKKMIVHTVGMIQRIIPGLEGLEVVSTTYLKEAAEAVKEAKSKIRFKVGKQR